MTDDYVQVQVDSTGKKLQTFKNTVGANDVHAEAMGLVNSSGAEIGSALAKESGGNLDAIKSDLDTIKTTGVPITSGTVTANAGTNLNTSALALEAGNLASIKTDVDKIPSKGTAAMAASTPVTIATDDTLVLAIKNKTDNLLAKGQATMANSSPVVIASDQSGVATAPVQTTRTNLTVKPEREDLTPLGGTASPNANGAQVIAGSGTKIIKVYSAGYEAVVAGLHYFYFGTSTTTTTKRFISRQTVGVIRQSFTEPVCGAAGDGLYLYSSSNDPNIPYDVNYVQE